MFTYEDFLKIFAYLQDGTASDLDLNTLKLALSEQIKSKSFIENTIDQTIFATDDYKRLKAFLVDWYSSHRTMITTQKNVSDIYSIPENHLNELFYSFGFTDADGLKYMPYENKILFFYDLVNLYKIKGTPYAIFKILNYFNIPNVEVCEYWLQKNSSSKLVLQARPVYTSLGNNSIGRTDVDFNVTVADPHWFLTESQIEALLTTNNIRLPSKTPYFGIRPVYTTEDVFCIIAYLARKVQDDYDIWNSGGTLEKNIRCSLGMEVSFLELYLGLIYIFKTYYNTSGVIDGSKDFVCYDGTTLPEYDILKEYYNTYNRRPLIRSDILVYQNTFNDIFTRKLNTHFLYDTFDVGIFLEAISSDFKAEIDYRTTSGSQFECVNLLLQDLSTWIRDNVDVNASSIANFISDFSGLSSWYLEGTINFFKPYRSRLLFVENVFSIYRPVDDTVIPEDVVSQPTITETKVDFDTANGLPGFYDDSTSLNYYSREHLDCGSYFDLGASGNDYLDVDILGDDIVFWWTFEGPLLMEGDRPSWFSFPINQDNVVTDGYDYPINSNGALVGEKGFIMDSTTGTDSIYFLIPGVLNVGEETPIMAPMFDYDQLSAGRVGVYFRIDILPAGSSYLYFSLTQFYTSAGSNTVALVFNPDTSNYEIQVRIGDMINPMTTVSTGFSPTLGIKYFLEYVYDLPERTIEVKIDGSSIFTYELEYDYNITPEDYSLGIYLALGTTYIVG